MKKWKKAAAILMAATILSGSLNVYAAGLRDVFDAVYYAETYPDLAASIGNDAEALYQHYVTCGLSEGRSGSKVFNVAEYRSAYADLEALFGDDWDAYVNHYCTVGKTEGRTAGVYGEIPLESDISNDVNVGNNMQQWMQQWTGLQPPDMNVASVSSNVSYVTVMGGNGDPLFMRLHEYDAAGNEVKITNYKDNFGTTIRGIIVVEYDGAGRKTKQASYNTDGTLDDWGWSYWAAFDEQGRTKILVSFNGDGTIKNVTCHEKYFEDTKSCLKWVCYYPDGSWSVSECEYDTTYGLGPAKVTIYNPDGSIESQY